MEGEMSLAIGIVLTVILIVLLIMSKRTKAAREKRPTITAQADSTTTTKFHAVSIHSTSSACEAAKSMQGIRFLSSAAPRLPLPECDAADCKCRFAHHADRRSGVDRRVEVPQNMLASTGGYTGKERRFHERRGSDEPRNLFA
jgi:hypothetical protein